MFLFPFAGFGPERSPAAARVALEQKRAFCPGRWQAHNRLPSVVRNYSFGPRCVRLAIRR